MIEDEDRAADDTPPPAANDNGNGDAMARQSGWERLSWSRWVASW